MKPWRSDFSLQTDHPSDHYPPIQPESPASSLPPAPSLSATLSDPFSSFLSLFLSIPVSFVRSNQIPGVRGRSARSLGLPRKFSRSYLGAVPIPGDGRQRWTWTWGWMIGRYVTTTKTRPRGRRRFVSNSIAKRGEVITIICFSLSLSLILSSFC